MNIQQIKELQANSSSKSISSLCVTPDVYRSNESIIAYPYFDVDTKETRLATARSYGVTGGAGFHTVVLSAMMKDGEPTFGVWCGDSFLEGKAADASARLVAAFREVHALLPDRNDRVNAMAMNAGGVPKNGGCNFWPAWRAGRGGCKHVAAVLASLGDGLEATFDALLAEYRLLVDGYPAKVAQPICPAVRWLMSLSGGQPLAYA